MTTRLDRRSYQVCILQTSPGAAPVALALREWLSAYCGLRVYHVCEASGDAAVVALARVQAAIIVGDARHDRSARAAELCRAEASRHETGAFRIAEIDLGASASAPLAGVSRFGTVEGEFRDGAGLLETLLGGPEPGDGRPVYLSRGWRADDAPLVETVKDALGDSGLRFVSGWPVATAQDDTERIIASCGALVAVLPIRDEDKTSKLVLRDIAAAQRLGLPCLVFADARVKAAPDWLFAVTAVDASRTDADMLRERRFDLIEDLSLAWRKPPAGQHVFVGHSEGAPLRSTRLITRLTGLPVIYGRMIEGGDVPGDIVRAIRDAEFGIFDITSPYTATGLPPKADFALNSSIEAGVALGAGRHFYLTCRGAERTPPFMFRSGQVRYYKTEMELIGYVSQFCSRHRRLVIE